MYCALGLAARLHCYTCAASLLYIGLATPQRALGESSEPGRFDIGCASTRRKSDAAQGSQFYAGAWLHSTTALDSTVRKLSLYSRHGTAACDSLRLYTPHSKHPNPPPDGAPCRRGATRRSSVAVRLSMSNLRGQGLSSFVLHPTHLMVKVPRLSLPSRSRLVLRRCSPQGPHQSRLSTSRPLANSCAAITSIDRVFSCI
jgi:hypothetical protein